MQKEDRWPDFTPPLRRDYRAVTVADFCTAALIGTGLSMSPGFNAVAPWLLDLFGGRQSARTIHFLTAFSLVAFVIVHVAMVVLSGVFNNLRSMITGYYAIEPEDMP